VRRRSVQARRRRPLSGVMRLQRLQTLQQLPLKELLC